MKRQFLLVGLFVAPILMGSVVSQDPDLRRQLESAFQKGMTLQRQGKSAEAVPFLATAVALAPKVFGPDHVNVGSIYSAAAFVNYGAGRFGEAEKLYRRSVDVHERIPDNHRRLAATLADLSAAQDELGKYDEAEKNIQRALAIQEMTRPLDEMGIALTLNNYGVLLSRLGRHAEAEPLFKRCITLREGKVGKDDPAVIDALHNLGGVYRQTRRDKEAEALAQRTLQMRKTRFGPDHIAVSQSLRELGLIAFNTGRFVQAEKYCLEVLRIRERAFGKNDPGAAPDLQNLALIYAGVGRAGEAEALYNRSLALSEARFGPDHPNVAGTLSNLSTLYAYLGRYDEAEKVLLRSIKIREAKSPDHPLLAGALNNLAAVYKEQDRLKDALSLFQRALAISERRLGKDHVGVAVSLNNLATLYRRMNNPDASLSLLQRALKINEKHYGEAHSANAALQNNLAMTYWSLGRFPEADRMMERSIKALYGKDVGDQIHVIDGLHNRAELNFALGRPRDALAFEKQALTLYQVELRKVFGFSSESNMHSFAEVGNTRLPSLVNMALQAKDVAGGTTEALDWTLRLKGAVFDTLCRYRIAQQLLPRDDSLQEQVARFRRQKEFLTNLALNPPSGKDAERVQKELEKAQHEVASLEKELTRTITQRIPDVASGRDRITTEMVRKRLPASGALVEFLRIPSRDFKAARWGSPHYIAFVVTPGNAPRLIDLGPAREIDAGVEAVRKEFTDFQDKLKECETAEEVKALERKQEKQFIVRSSDLHARLFAPLRDALGKASLLYLAPDGALNRLPFEALVGPDGKYLIEHYQCAYLTSGRDLLRTPTPAAKGTVVFANPDFKLDADERAGLVEKLMPKKTLQLAMRGQPARGLRSVGWRNLPGAAAEAKDIQKNLQDGTYGPVKTYVGPHALEEVLKAMPAPRVLHLATHGFFLDREPDAKEPGEDGAGAGWARGRLKRMDNPLLRSGIVLAGANTIGDKDTPARGDDGWVTAEEIALLNLHGTELVVLSACQTGLGDIKSGEGVQGLRRAFLYAGAQTLLTSLFEVPDAETRDLMNRFYSRFKTGGGKLRALHSAQRSFIDDRRKTQGAAHPFFWASFVLVGDPG